jgi:hypothetical protein
VTTYARGHGRIGFSDGKNEVLFGPDGNVEGYYDSYLRQIPLNDVGAAATTFWRSLTYRSSGDVDIHFTVNISAVVSTDGKVTLDYKPNALTKRFWEAVALHCPSRPQTVAPKPVVFKDVGDCCPTYDTDRSKKPFDFDVYNGVKN